MAISGIVSQAKPQNDELFRVATGDVVFRIAVEPKQPYWEGHAGAGLDPLVIRLTHGSTTAAYYDCVGKLCGILLEGLAIDPMIEKSVKLDSKGKVSILFKGNDGGIEILFNDMKIELTTQEAINLRDVIIDYWRVKPNHPQLLGK